MTARPHTNFEMAVKSEMKKVVRGFHHYSTDQVSLLRNRVGRPCRKALDEGEFFYTHPDVSGICFRSRSQAASYALMVSP
jgi:hypothetical protein